MQRPRPVQHIVDEDQVGGPRHQHGFGKLVSTKIAHERPAELQRNLRAFAQRGTGNPLPDHMVVRLALATKAVSPARWHSGARTALVRTRCWLWPMPMSCL